MPLPSLLVIDSLVPRHTNAVWSPQTHCCCVEALLAYEKTESGSSRYKPHVIDSCKTVYPPPQLSMSGIYVTSISAVQP